MENNLELVLTAGKYKANLNAPSLRDMQKHSVKLGIAPFKITFNFIFAKSLNLASAATRAKPASALAYDVLRSGDLLAVVSTGAGSWHSSSFSSSAPAAAKPPSPNYATSC